MRIAILSALATLPSDPERLTAAQTVLGRSVLQRQVEVARALGCEKIVCLVSSANPCVMQAQIKAENDGLAFHTVTHHRALSGLVTSADELVVMIDGLVVQPDCIPALLTERRGILTFPADRSVLINFERVDAGAAWAGLMVIGGSAVEHLMELPDENAAVPSLLRIALQAQIPQIPLDKSLLAEYQWTRVTGADAVVAIDQRRAGDLLPGISPAAPGIWLGRQLAVRARLNGIEWLQRPVIALTVVALLALGALTTAYFSAPVWGLALLSTVAIFEWASRFSWQLGIERAGAKVPRPFAIIRSVLDTAFIGVIAMPWPVMGDWEPAFAAIALIIGLNILPTVEDSRTGWLVKDRLPIILYAFLASLGGVLHPAAAFLALTVLGAILFKRREKQDIRS